MTRPSLLRRRRARGFTLIELMVATLAGLTVSFGAFAFARAATRSFQQETRLSDATSNATIGFRRLISDIERAGYLAPSNIQREYRFGNRVCLEPNNSFSTAIQSLSSLEIEQSATTTGTTPNTSVTNASGVSIPITPDRLTLSGSYASVEQFPVRSVDVSGSTPVVYLESRSGAAMRTMNGNTTATPWTNVFQIGRILRIVDREGYQHFGHITAINATGQFPQITLKSTPPLYMRGKPAPTLSNPLCKGFDIGVGSLANVVNRIRYEIRDLRASARYQALYPSNPPLPEDNQRWELVRYELDEGDSIIADSEELIAEFAVDLRFALTAITDQVLDPANPNPTLQFFDFGAPPIAATYARRVGPANLNPGPERIRSLRVRFSVRSREPDRSEGLNPALVGAGPQTLFRYQIPNSTRYARVRTLHADVSMSNQIGVFY
jgi:prepilin-type N-terminal cleavage/methylation domain-containing protein